MPNAKWYASKYERGDEVMLLTHGRVTGVDVTDNCSALEVEGRWADTFGYHTIPILGAEGYDKLVDLLSVDELLAAIERKVGNTPPDTEPEYRTGCHWRDLAVGDVVEVRCRRDGEILLASVTEVEPDHYTGACPVEVTTGGREYVKTWLCVRDDKDFPLEWPEGIEYDH